jgi:hypothetical protein
MEIVMEPQVNTLVDFAPHKLETDRLLKEAHLLCIEGQYKEAVALIDAAIVELRLMRAALKSHD